MVYVNYSCTCYCSKCKLYRQVHNNDLKSLNCETEASHSFLMIKPDFDSLYLSPKTDFKIIQQLKARSSVVWLLLCFERDLWLHDKTRFTKPGNVPSMLCLWTLTDTPL